MNSQCQKFFYIKSISGSVQPNQLTHILRIVAQPNPNAPERFYKNTVLLFAESQLWREHEVSLTPKGATKRS